MSLTADAGELDDAERYARLAFRAYGRGHPDLPALRQDAADLHIAKRDYGRALAVVQKALSERHSPQSRAFTLALTRPAPRAPGAPLRWRAWQTSSRDRLPGRCVDFPVSRSRSRRDN
jgi:hypothetical protein